MKSLRLSFAVFFAVVAWAYSCFAQDQPSAPVKVDGFVFCSNAAQDQPVPIFLGLCNRRQIGTLNCGEKVEVVSRHDDMLSIVSSERPPRRLVSVSAISRQPDKFVPFDDQSGIPEGRAPDCSRLQKREAGANGFVFCSGHDESVPTYFNACQNHPAGALSCGETITVVSRNGDMLRVRLENGLPRYVPYSSISQRADQMVPFGDDSDLPDGGAPDCSQPPKPSITPPRATYIPPPEFSDEARRKKIQGAVRLSLTVGTDGRAHDIKVEKGIGYGLDEKAVEAVSRWKFEPALKDGQPIEKQISVDVSFKLY